MPNTITSTLSAIAKACGPDLTLRHLAILEATARGVDRVRHVTDETGISKPCVSRLAGTMREYVTKTRCPSDGRDVILSPTPDGLALLAMLKEVLDRHAKS